MLLIAAISSVLKPVFRVRRTAIREILVNHTSRKTNIFPWVHYEFTVLSQHHDKQTSMVHASMLSLGLVSVTMKHNTLYGGFMIQDGWFGDVFEAFVVLCNKNLFYRVHFFTKECTLEKKRERERANI